MPLVITWVAPSGLGFLREKLEAWRPGTETANCWLKIILWFRSDTFAKPVGLDVFPLVGKPPELVSLSNQLIVSLIFLFVTIEEVFTREPRL